MICGYKVAVEIEYFHGKPESYDLYFDLEPII